jgi:flagellar hook-associated protein 2
MSTSSSTSASPIFNISGIASGIDTNSIITQLMSIERQPQVRIKQQQTVEAARKQALQDVNTRLLNLQTSFQALRDPGLWADSQEVDSSDTSRITAIQTGGAAAGGYSIGVTRLARAQQLTQGTAATNAAADERLTIQVGAGTAVNVDVSSGDDLATVASKINGTSGVGVYASVVNSKLVLSGKSTGAINAISVTGTGAADFGFAQTQSALDAQYTVDGVAKTSSSNIVTDALAGVSLTLKATTTSDVSISISAPGPNSSSIQSSVQSFIDQYNSTIDFIQSKLTEKVVPNATTDADRIKGVLHSDQGLESLLSSLRESISNPVSGMPANLTTLAQVGVSTGATTGSGTLNQDSIDGKLTLNASTLTSALASDFSNVKKLFTNAAATPDAMGLSQRLDALVTPMVSASGVIAGRIASEQSTIDDLVQQSADMDTRLATKEASLRQQFTAMETALSQAQSQGSYLAGQIAGLSSGG